MVDTIEHDVSIDSGSYTISRFASGFEYNYDRELREIYDEAIDLAVKKGDKSLEAHLKESKDQYLKLVEHLKSNQDGVRIEVSASTQGYVADRKGGHANASVDMMVACISAANARDQIASHFHFQWPTTSPSDVYKVMLSNTAKTTQYVTLAIGPAVSPCDAASRRLAGYTVAPNEGVAAGFGPHENACYAWSERTLPKAKFKPSCHATNGDTIDMDKVPSCKAV